MSSFQTCCSMLRQSKTLAQRHMLPLVSGICLYPACLRIEPVFHHQAQPPRLPGRECSSTAKRYYKGMNQDQSSLSEILFFGMKLEAGREEVYSIENEEGQMEICHLTNCALVSESTSKKPIYVRMKNPDVDSEFVIGALVPGQVYSFQTDLMIPPDTSFSHSGGPKDEVHLTGYRTVNSESMFMGEDLDDTDDEMDEDLEDEEDDDFVVDDDEKVEMEGDSEDDEEEKESGDDDEEENEPKNRVIRGKVDIKEEKDFARLVKERAKAREKLQKLCEQGNEMARLPDLVDEDIKALEGGFLWGGEDGDSDDDLDMGPGDGEDVDDDDEVKRHMAEILAEDGDEEEDDEEDDDSDGDEDDDDDEDKDEDNVGSIPRTKQKSSASNRMVKDERVSRRMVSSKKAATSEEEDEDEEDDDADPSKRAKAVTLARQQQEKIERQKQKQKLNGVRQANDTGTPVAAPEKSGKKRKASLGVEGDENNGTPAKKAAKGVSHPKTVNDATQQYADALFKALSAHGKPMSMALLSQKVKKPEGAEKVGKLVTKYECFTRGTEGKAKDMVSLTETVGAKLPATV